MFLHPREAPYLEDGGVGKIPLTVLVKMGEINIMTLLWQKHIGNKRVASVHMDLPAWADSILVAPNAKISKTVILPRTFYGLSSNVTTMHEALVGMNTWVSWVFFIHHHYLRPRSKLSLKKRFKKLYWVIYESSWAFFQDDALCHNEVLHNHTTWINLKMSRFYSL